MTHRTRLGPIAIFLIIVTMVITTLAILTVATSNADRVMAERFAYVTQTRYELEAQAEHFINEVVENSGKATDIRGLPEGAAAAENGYTYTAEKDGYRIEAEITAPDADGNFEIVKWKVSRIWKADDPLKNIWQGF